MKPTLAGPRSLRAGPRVAELPPELAGLPQAVVRLDARGGVEAANPVFEEWLAAGGSVVGLPLEHLLAGWLGAAAETGLTQWRAWWALRDRVTLTLEGCDGRHLQFARSSTDLLVINDVSGFRQRERALLMTARHLEDDVLERTRALEQARQSAERAQRSKSRFFAAASHDLLQPLNAARIYAAALADIPGLDPVAVDVSRRIDVALRNAEDIVDTLVDVARFEASGVEAQVETLELDRLLEPLVDQYSSVARSRGLELRWHACGLQVRSDPRLLRRVLQNLIGNALRYTGRGGVLIGARRRGERVRIEVWDTGPGIAPAQQSLVFEEFRRLDQHSPWGERGLGLGLWICRRIAALLDHALDLRSQPGRGSVFAIELPIADADSAPAPASPVRAVGPVQGCASRPLALALEGNADVRAALVTLLRGWGLEVLAEADPVRAVSALAGRHPLLVLVDEAVVGGLAVLEDWPVREGLPQRLYCTGERGEELARWARECGVLLLGKPLKPARLRAIVEDAVRRSATHG